MLWWYSRDTREILRLYPVDTPVIPGWHYFETMLAFWRGFDQPTAMLSTVKMLPDKVDPSVVCIGEDLLGGGNCSWRLVLQKVRSFEFPYHEFQQQPRPQSLERIAQQFNTIQSKLGNCLTQQIWYSTSMLISIFIILCIFASISLPTIVHCQDIYIHYPSSLC
jgi:hypothetical protein